MATALALFDFDGTLTTHDTFVRYFRFACGDFRFAAGVLCHLPQLILAKLNVIPRGQAKQALTRFFLQGWTESRARDKGELFCMLILPGLLRAKGLAQLNWHLAEGHRVVLVSASLDIWLKPWCDQMGIELLCTQLASYSGQLTGEFSTANCIGPEKVRRISEIIDLSHYTRIYAYGDSAGDTEMLGVATDPNFRVFH